MANRCASLQCCSPISLLLSTLPLSFLPSFLTHKAPLNIFELSEMHQFRDRNIITANLTASLTATQNLVCQLSSCQCLFPGLGSWRQEGAASNACESCMEHRIPWKIPTTGTVGEWKTMENNGSLMFTVLHLAFQLGKHHFTLLFANVSLQTQAAKIFFGTDACMGADASNIFNIFQWSDVKALATDEEEDEEEEEEEGAEIKEENGTAEDPTVSRDHWSMMWKNFFSNSSNQQFDERFIDV